MSLFTPGEAVVCVDAADIPSPPWTPIQTGHSYVIRAVDPIPPQDGNYDKNIHKHARFQVRLWGVSNPIHPIFGIEMGYAETRFERIEPEDKMETTEEKSRNPHDSQLPTPYARLDQGGPNDEKHKFIRTFGQ